MGHGYGGHGDWGWGLLGALLPLLFWGGLLLTLALAVRGGLPGRLGGQLPPTPANRPVDRALAILRERYARGEIDSTEYEERRRWLLDDPPNL
jgi:putative membrane protein